jgi:hypothetical protein
MIGGKFPARLSASCKSGLLARNKLPIPGTLGQYPGIHPDQKHGTLSQLRRVLAEVDLRYLDTRLWGRIGKMKMESCVSRKRTRVRTIWVWFV